MIHAIPPCQIQAAQLMKLRAEVWTAAGKALLGEMERGGG